VGKTLVLKIENDFFLLLRDNPPSLIEIHKSVRIAGDKMNADVVRVVCIEGKASSFATGNVVNASVLSVCVALRFDCALGGGGEIPTLTATRKVRPKGM
jgi:hypothetical protein